MERHLSGLRDARQAEAGKREDHQRGGNRAEHDEVSEVDALEVDGQVIQRAQECDAAHQVHDDLAERVVDGFIGFREADEQKRAQRGYFPGGEQPHQVVEENDAVHGGEEHEHQREKRGPAVGLLGIGVMDAEVEIVHVADGVHADARADDADDQRHDERERIKVKRFIACKAVREAELVEQGSRKLDNRQNNSGDVLVFDAKADDDNADNDAYGQTCVINDV